MTWQVTDYLICACCGVVGGLVASIITTIVLVAVRPKKRDPRMIP